MRFTRSGVLAAGTATCVLALLVIARSACRPESAEERLEAVTALLQSDFEHAADGGSSARAAAVATATDTLLEDQTTQSLLSHLDDSHARVAERFGAHLLSYRTILQQTPQHADRRPQGAHELQTQRELKLHWRPGSPHPSFALEQGVGSPESRQLRMLGETETMYSQTGAHPWYQFPKDSDIHERWLDDAFHCVRDVVQFAGPSVRVDARVSESGRIIARLSLEPGGGDRHPAGDPRLGRPEPSPWRDQVHITSVSGEVELDAQHLIWTNARIELRYALDGVDGRPALAGRLDLSAQLRAPTSSDPRPSAPDAAEPLPQRRRLEVERAELLRGLAPS